MLALALLPQVTLVAQGRVGEVAAGLPGRAHFKQSGKWAGRARPTLSAFGEGPQGVRALPEARVLRGRVE